MKRKYQPITIVFLLFATVSLLSVIFIKYYEKDEVLAFENTEEVENTEAIGSTELVEDTEDSVSTQFHEVADGIDGSESFQDLSKEKRWRFAPSDISYFDDALFIGDSRTNGIFCYGTFENAAFFAEDGMNIYELWQIRVPVEGYGKVRLESLLNNKSFSKIYIMMGINELGEDQEVTAQKYKEALDRLHELEPNAIIYICSNLHVSEKQSLQHDTFNNTNIDLYNERIRAFADENTFFYLDVNQVFNDEAGNLKAEYTWDNIHLYGRYYDEWCEWFCQNTVKKMDIKVEGYIRLED